MTEAATPATSTTAAQSATNGAVPESTVARNADGTVDITAFAAMANAELAREAELDAARDAAAKAKEPGAKERGKDGKFKAQDAAAKDKPEPAAKPEPEPEKQEPPKPTNSHAALRRLWQDGKLVEFFQAIGQDIETIDQLHIPSRALAHARRDLAQALKSQRETQQLAQQVHQRFAPVDKAMRLRDAGDVRGALEAFFGKALEDVQADIVTSYHKTDPAVAKTQAEMRALREELAARDRQQAEMAQRQSLAQKQAEERKTLEGWLAESEDARVAAVAGKRAFVDAVIAKAKEHYNPRTRVGIPWSEAAQLAYEDLYGNVLDTSDPAPRREQTDRRPGTSAKTDRRPDTTVKRANLSPERSADAAPLDMPEPGSPEMVQYWARRGMAELHKPR